jgi:allantoinase
MKPRSYGPFPYSLISQRPPLKWPNGARVALWVVPNIESFSLLERPGGLGPGKIPDIPTWAVRDYGNRVGIARIMQVLDRYGIRATVALNSDICINHSAIIEEGCARRWEWMGHNQSNTRRLNEVSAEDEIQIIRDTLSTIERASGVRPIGWLGSGLQETWNTLDNLSAAGCEYVADWGANDDQPYMMTLDDGKTLVSVPYSYDINDKQAYERRNVSASDFREMICRQFDVLYREGQESGRVIHIALHPYLTGLPYRIDALDQALEYICRHEGVWLTTGGEIARYYRTQISEK